MPRWLNEDREVATKSIGKLKLFRKRYFSIFSIFRALEPCRVQLKHEHLVFDGVYLLAGDAGRLGRSGDAGRNTFRIPSFMPCAARPSAPCIWSSSPFCNQVFVVSNSRKKNPSSGLQSNHLPSSKYQARVRWATLRTYRWHCWHITLILCPTVYALKQRITGIRTKGKGCRWNITFHF